MLHIGFCPTFVFNLVDTHVHTLVTVKTLPFVLVAAFVTKSACCEATKSVYCEAVCRALGVPAIRGSLPGTVKGDVFKDGFVTD